jgi:hypothetical protein
MISVVRPTSSFASASSASAQVTAPFTAGSTAGSGTVRIQAYADFPAANIFATTFVTVRP